MSGTNKAKQLSCLAKNKLESGDLQKAIELFNQSLSIKKDWDTYNGLGWALLNADLEQEAIKAFKNSLEIKKDYISYQGLGWSLFHTKNYKEAIDAFIDSLQIKKDWSTFNGLGWSFFNINQFHNPLNIQCHYNTTANEIVEYFQQNPHLTFPNTIISRVGTGGTIMGVSKRLREINPNLKVVIIEPAESNVFSGGTRGKHKIQGIGDGNTYLLDMDIVDEIIEIKSEDAVSRCKKMYREGFYVGISSAAYILAAENYLSRNPDAHIITFMCDTGSKYMSII